MKFHCFFHIMLTVLSDKIFLYIHVLIINVKYHETCQETDFSLNLLSFWAIQVFEHLQEFQTRIPWHLACRFYNVICTAGIFHRRTTAEWFRRGGRWWWRVLGKKPLRKQLRLDVDEQPAWWSSHRWRFVAANQSSSYLLSSSVERLHQSHLS